MDRKSEIIRFATQNDLGIEIAPFFSPLLPKTNGFNCLSIDVFDQQKLIEIAKKDPNIPKESIPNIELVDIVGSAVEIETLIKRKNLGNRPISYIISSHNLEHLPNPIRFLQGCSAVLRSGGILSLAIPDKRGCFDYYRQTSELADFLQAYIEKRERPTNYDIFSGCCFPAYIRGQNGEKIYSFSQMSHPGSILAVNSIRREFQKWNERHDNVTSEYFDAHCWTFTPASFQLLLVQLQAINLINFNLIQLVEGNNNEFIVHLQNSPENQRHINDLEILQYYRLAIIEPRKQKTNSKFQLIIRKVKNILRRVLLRN